MVPEAISACQFAPFQVCLQGKSHGFVWVFYLVPSELLLEKESMIRLLWNLLKSAINNLQISQSRYIHRIRKSTNHIPNLYQ